MATSDEEQAVSVETQGPWRPKVKERRPTMKDRPCPTMEEAAPSAAPDRANTPSKYSVYMQPT
jgi:hypothetical protein